MTSFLRKILAATFLSFVMVCGLFAQTTIPQWDFSGWEPFAPIGSDSYYLMQYRDKNLSSLPYNTLVLENVPMGNKSKPAIFIKVKDANYRTWSNYAEPDMHKWDYYLTDNYVMLSFEMSFRSDPQQPLNNTNAGDKLYFRCYLDPQDNKTGDLVSNWISLEGPFVVFFLSDNGINMNYYYNYVPKASKDIAKISFDKAKAELIKISEKGTATVAINILAKDHLLMEVYRGTDTSKFESDHWGPVKFP